MALLWSFRYVILRTAAELTVQNYSMRSYDKSRYTIELVYVTYARDALIWDDLCATESNQCKREEKWETGIQEWFTGEVNRVDVLQRKKIWSHVAM